MTPISSAGPAARIREFIADNFLYMRPDFRFGDTDSLIATGIVDSLGVMEMISFVETEFGVGVEDVEVTEANFGSVAAMAAYVEAKLRAAADDVPEPRLRLEA